MDRGGQMRGRVYLAFALFLLVVGLPFAVFGPLSVPITLALIVFISVFGIGYLILSSPGMEVYIKIPRPWRH